MSYLLFFVLELIFCHESYARIAPDFIQPCPGLTKECLEQEIQNIIPNFVKGIPSLGIGTLDPLYIAQMELMLPGNLKLEFKNGTVHGLQKCIVENAYFENSEQTLNVICNVTIEGKYKANGNLLIMKINGDGDARIKVYNLRLQGKFRFHDVNRDGITYYEIENLDFKYEFGDNVTFQLTNLFKGNPELSNAVLQFINANWKQLVEEFGAPIFNKLVEIVIDVPKKFFMAVPKNEMFIY